jgi:hypothetical protein
VALLVIAPAARPRTAALLPHHYYSSPTAQHYRRESEVWCCVFHQSTLARAQCRQTRIPFLESSHLTTQPPPPRMPFLMAADGHSHRIQQPAGQVVICEPLTLTLSKKAGEVGGHQDTAKGRHGLTSHRLLLLSSLHFLCNKATRKRGHYIEPKSWPTRGQCSATRSPDQEARLAPRLPPTPTPRTVVGTWL